MSKSNKTESFPMPSPYSPPTQIRLTKDQAGDFAIGDMVKITVSGKVVSIRQNKGWDEKNKKDMVTGYEVELENSSVVDIGTNPAARSLKEMKGT